MSVILAETQKAEMLAVQALAFIAEDDGRLVNFIASTGIAMQSIRDAAREPNFLVGVLEHILADENLLIAFADNVAIDPTDVARARQTLGNVWERDVP
jgi:hypothetical protein